MVTEFGGIDYRAPAARPDGWGYSSAHDEEDWLERLRALHGALRASSAVVGGCYTQLTDTAQETNGLLTADRRPKAPIARIRRAVTGEA